MAVPVGLLFCGIVVTMILVNFDSGATAAVLNDLSLGCKMKGKHLNPDYDPRFPCLSTVDQGMLGALPFVGLCVGCPVVGRVLGTCSEKSVVLAGVLLDACATFVFAYVSEKHNLFLAKFLIGVSHSAICIYTPVWVNHFGPPRSKTTWIGVVQGTAAIGTMVGYAATGYLTACGMFYQNAFRVQAFGLVCCAIGLMSVPRTQVDSKYAQMQEDTEELQTVPESQPLEVAPPEMEPTKFRSNSEHFASFAGGHFTSRARSLSESFSITSHGREVGLGRERSLSFASTNGRLESILDDPDAEFAADEDVFAVLGQLLCNRMFRSLTFGLCALFFVVTGIQYWMTKYLLVSFSRPRVEVNTVFIFVAGSAPVLGIGMGGPVVDYLGGYDSPEGAKRTALLAGAWGAIASLAGMMAAMVEPGEETWRMIAVVSGTWVELLFGAAMLPPVTGLILYSVADNVKVTANALAMLVQNLFGYGIGAYLPGQVATLSEMAGDDDKVAMHYAMQVVFFWALFGLLGMLDAYFAVHARH